MSEPFKELKLALDKTALERLEEMIAENEALKSQLAEAGEILDEVATMKISWFDGCSNESDHETRPIKVEIRETIQARKARAFLDKIKKGDGCL